MELDSFVSKDELYIFTDGAAKNNNDPPNCKAGWGYFSVSNGLEFRNFDHVPKSKDSYPSNQRGELSAIYFALLNLKTEFENFKFKKVILVSDSDYSLKIINIWYESWVKKNQVESKKNLDIIIPMMSLVKEIKLKFSFSTTHVNSHQKEPIQKNHGWFLWKGNTEADHLANLGMLKNVD